MTTAVMAGEKVSTFADDLQYYMRVYPEKVHARHREADQQLLCHLERMIRERAGTLSSETSGGHIVITEARPRQLVRDLPEAELEEFVDELQSDSYYKGWKLGQGDSVIERIDERFLPLNAAYVAYRSTSRTTVDPQKVAERVFEQAVLNGKHDMETWGLGKVVQQPSMALAEKQRAPVITMTDDEEDEDEPVFDGAGRRI